MQWLSQEEALAKAASRTERKIADYTNATYPCKVYTLSDDSFLSSSEVCQCSVGGSDISVEDAIEDLRTRIEEDIEYCATGEGGWIKWYSGKMPPLPDELLKMSLDTWGDDFLAMLKDDGCYVLDECSSTVTVFPNGQKPMTRSRL